MNNKSGYAYLKEKIAKLEARIERQKEDLRRLDFQKRELETKYEKLDDATQKEAFNRMIREIKELRGW